MGTYECSCGTRFRTVSGLNKLKSVGRKIETGMPVKHSFRRCHICGSVGHSPKNIRKCGDCGKPFAPFYYFNDEFTPVLTEGELRPPLLEGQWRPIHGLTAYWQVD